MSKKKEFYQEANYQTVLKYHLDDIAIRNKVYTAFRERVLEFREKKERLNFLDCGTGTGGLIIRLIEDGIIVPGDRVLGFDTSEQMLEATVLWDESIEGRSLDATVTGNPDIFSFNYWRDKVTDKNPHFIPIPNEKCVRSFGVYLLDYVGVSSQNSNTVLEKSKRKRNKTKTKSHRRMKKETPKDIKIFFRKIGVHGLEKAVGRDHFDVVMAQSLLEHTNAEIALRNMYSVMRQDGLLYLPSNYSGGTKFLPKYKSKEGWTETKLINVWNGRFKQQQHDDVKGGNAYFGQLLVGANPFMGRNGFKRLSTDYSTWKIAIPRESYNVNELMFMKWVLGKIKGDLLNDDLMNKEGYYKSDVERWYQDRVLLLDQRKLGYECTQRCGLYQKMKAVKSKRK